MSDTFALSPSALSIDSSQSCDLTDGRAYGKSLSMGNLTNDFEMHAIAGSCSGADSMRATLMSREAGSVVLLDAGEVDAVEEVRVGHPHGQAVQVVEVRGQVAGRIDDALAELAVKNGHVFQRHLPHEQEGD